ncbi:MAG: HAD family hydrolase [Dehalococcoidia bacterium]
MIKAIIYDIGGTLLYPKPPIEELCAYAEAASGLHIPHAAFGEALPYLRHFMAERDQPAGTLWGSDDLMREAWAEYYAHAMQAAGVVAPHEQMRHVGRIMSDWYTHADRWAMFDDVPPVLTEAARRGLVQGVISDWGTDLVDILHGLEISPHMQFVVASATVGYGKPSPEIFQAALVRAGVPPRDALYVGDTYTLDVLGARAAGMPAVLIDRDSLSPPLDCPVLHRLDELFLLLDAEV